MKYIYNLSFLGILAVMCSACKTQIITPAIVPPVEIEAPQPVPTSHSLGIIGGRRTGLRAADENALCRAH